MSNSGSESGITGRHKIPGMPEKTKPPRGEIRSGGVRVNPFQ